MAFGASEFVLLAAANAQRGGGEGTMGDSCGQLLAPHLLAVSPQDSHLTSRILKLACKFRLRTLQKADGRRNMAV